MSSSAWAALDEAVRSALAANDLVAEQIVAERDGELVGSVMLYPPAVSAYGDIGGSPLASWPELRLLAVSPSARGLGIGRALVDACVERARALGATHLGLHTSMSMRAAMQLYMGLGFVRAPELDFQPAGAELVEGYVLKLA